MKDLRCAQTLLLIGMLSAGSTAAFASDGATDSSTQNGAVQDVDAEIQNAVELFQAGAYEAAIEKFKLTYNSIEDPNILFNIARCYQELNDVDNAKEYFNRVIYHPEASENTKSAARKRLKKLNDEGVTSPLVDKSGATEEAYSESNVDIQQPTASETEAPKVSRRLEWTLIGIGAAVTVTGVAFGGAALAKHSAFESSQDRDEKKDLENTGRAFALTSDIALGVGLVTLATGVILFVARGRKNSDESTTTAFVPSATRDSLALSWMVRF